MSGTQREIMSKNRIESFSDNVFSIVLTLLVFSFKLPKLESGDPNGELYQKLLAMYPYFITYLLSFVLITMLWVAHHKLFQTLRHSDTPLLWINGLFLLCLAFIPFPAEVLGAYPGTESAAVFFGATMVTVSFSFLLLRYYCYYPGNLADDSVSDAYKRKSLSRALLGVVLYTVAITVSVISPDITLSLYILIPFLYFVQPPRPRARR